MQRNYEPHSKRSQRSHRTDERLNALERAIGNIKSNMEAVANRNRSLADVNDALGDELARLKNMIPIPLTRPGKTAPMSERIKWAVNQLQTVRMLNILLIIAIALQIVTILARYIAAL